MKRIISHLFVVVLLMLSATSWAQTALVHGKVYHIQNAHFTDRAVTAVDGQIAKLGNAVTNKSDVKQQWYVIADGSKYLFRNVYNGQYLSQTAQNGWGLTATRDADSNKFEYIVAGEVHNTIRSTSVSNNSNGYMHLGSENGNIQGWGSGSGGTQWDFTLIDYTNEQLDALFDNFISEETIRFSLSAIFSDAACTVLNDEYASMSLENIKADANYIALPAALQKTVLKIKNENWYEENADNTKEAWDAEYAKKFRVQMYEPYSAAKTGSNGITSWLGINWHANNDNPTGIYMPAAGALYVMVEGEIKQGATLRIVDAGSNDRITNAATGGYALQQGLNVIEFTQAGGMLYICYNVDTYNPDGTDDATRFPHKLSEFAPLKIHIEGGAINGFYNACGDFRATNDAEDLWKTITEASVDKDADWEYMETRANLSVLPILGHRQILLFSLGETEGNKGMAYYLPENITVPDIPFNRTKNWGDYGMGCDPLTGKINIMLEAWDRIMYSELATMGLVSKSDMERMNDFYPRWTSEGSPTEIYDYENKSALDDKTYLEFCGVDYSEVFNHHGVALGVGGNSYMYGSGDHCGYNHNTMNGVIQTIASNAGSTWGPAHEIGHQHQGLLNLNGLTEVTNNLFSNIALWYKGMSTSRYNGNDGSLEKVLEAFNTNGSDTYTNNIWALTHLYYRLWLYYHLAGNNTQFYPRLFELLRHEPMQKGYNVSGESSMLHFYKLACQAAGEDLTEFFRVHGYFAVMENRLVGDYSNSVYNTTQKMIDEVIAEVKNMGYRENLAVIFINDDDETANYVQHDGQTKREIYGETKPNSDFGSVSDFISGNIPVETAYTVTISADGTVTMSGGAGGVGFLVLNEKGEVVSFSNKSTFALGDEAMETIVSGKATIKSVDSNNNVVEADVDITALQRGVLGALIAKAQPIVDKIDETYTRIGYFKGAAVADLKDVLAYAKDVYAGSSGYEAAYDILYAEYQKVLDMPDAKITVDLNRKYIITNNAYPTRNIAVDGITVYALDDRTSAAQWSLVETGTADSYYLKNSDGYYCPAVVTGGTGGDATKEITSAGVYTLKELEHGLWAIIGKNAPLHASKSQSYNVVGWSYEAAASQWYITATETDEKLANLSELQALIAKTELLLDEVAGTVTYTAGEELNLQTEKESDAYYLSSNAPETREGDIAYLVDGNTNNYFHTDWSSEPPSGSHYLLVDLGENNTMERFTFSHTTRSDAQTDFPRSVDVYGADEKDGVYKYLGSVSDMPQSAGTAWKFDGVMVASHRYLRFNYHANRGYWHMAEFDIAPIVDFTVNVNDVYRSNIDEGNVITAMSAMLNAKGIVAGISPAKDDIYEKLQELQVAYNALYAQYEETVNVRKKELAELVKKTEVLIVKVGEVAFAKESKFELTTENLYCNDPHLHANKEHDDYSENYVAKLIDGNIDTFLHTDYGNTNSGTFPHYLRVDLGEHSTATGFRFTYTTRNNGNNCPTEIVVAGCATADGEYTTICTLKDTDSNPLPNGAALVYESSVISRQPAYRYIRFTVTKTETTENTFFVMSEFGFTTVSNEITVYDAYKGYLTEDLLLNTVLVTKSSSAISTNDLVTSVPLLDAQITDQRAAKDALYAAMLPAERYTLAVTDVGYATLYLGFNAIIPAGVEAYYVDEINMRGNANMVQVSNVLPAETGVIIKAAKGEYTFKYSNENVAAIEKNMLKGTLEDTLINKEVGCTYYVLANKSGIGFYEAVYNGISNQFMNTANKAYLYIPSTVGTAAFYGFDWGETTGVGKAEIRTEKSEIYDLAGRRVEAVTAPGVYIVDGKKILVK